MTWFDRELIAAIKREPLLWELPQPTDRPAWLNVRYARARRLAARVGVYEIHMDTAYQMARVEAEMIEVNTAALLGRKDSYRLMTDIIDDEAPQFSAAYETLLATQYRALIEAATTAIRCGAREMETRRTIVQAARAMTPPAEPHLLAPALWAATNAERWNARWLNSRRTA